MECAAIMLDFVESIDNIGVRLNLIAIIDSGASFA